MLHRDGGAVGSFCEKLCPTGKCREGWSFWSKNPQKQESPSFLWGDVGEDFAAAKGGPQPA